MKILRHSRSLMFLLVCLAPLPSLQAWNDRGHMLIALLAYRQLPAAQKKKVDELLAAHPHYELFLTRNQPAGVSPQEWAFLRAATWPDFVRNAEHRANFHRAKWHYINLPFIPPGEESHLTGPPFETPTINILVAIDECRDVLREDYPAASRKAIHLAWLEHLIGDIHQPLHCITLVHRAYPRGDLGGNLLAVRSRDSVKRLHGYWDDALGFETNYPDLAKAADEIAADPALARSAFSELLTKETPRAWAEEGFALGKRHVYLDGTLPFVPYEAYEQKQLAKEQVPQLPEEYEQTARQLARRRAALASYRLTDALVDCLRRHP
jgi:hypothetical protein